MNLADEEWGQGAFTPKDAPPSDRIAADDACSEHRGTRFPIARLRYTQATSQWAIYWRDRHLKFHEHKRKGPIFWG